MTTKPTPTLDDLDAAVLSASAALDALLDRQLPDADEARITWWTDLAQAEIALAEAREARADTGDHAIAESFRRLAESSLSAADSYRRARKAVTE